jgi:hypothetical protein
VRLLLLLLQVLQLVEVQPEQAELPADVVV